MFIRDLLQWKYDLAAESKEAGFQRNVDHFKSFLANCPRYAIGKYGRTKYHALRKQLGLPKFLG
jgi:hypothetical protein